MTALINPYVLAAVGPTDPNFASVVLLLHFDGADGATTTTDSSPLAHTVVPTGAGAKLTTANKQFGTASMDLSAGAYVIIADNAAWHFGAGQFTVECWIRPTVAPVSTRAFVAQFGNSDRGWFFGFNGNTLNFFYSTTGADLPVVSGAYTPTLNTWVHVAADRDASNVLRVYANGSVIASATVSATFWDAARSLQIGNDVTATRNYTGQVDEVRITKGVARYGGAFTPPTAAFPNS